MIRGEGLFVNMLLKCIIMHIYYLFVLTSFIMSLIMHIYYVLLHSIFIISLSLQVYSFSMQVIEQYEPRQGIGEQHA